MPDSRYQALADTLIDYSCALKAGDKVLIESSEVPAAFINTLIAKAASVGAHPVVSLKHQSIGRQLLLCATEEQLEITAKTELARMKEVNAYIGIRGSENVSELADVPAENMRLFESMVLKPVHFEQRVKHTRWVVLRWPHPSMAQLAQMPTEPFEDFYFRVCTLDYQRMAQAMLPLQELMEATDRVRLVAPGTDLSFSIHGIPAVCCDGRNNIPDGEVFTAPVRDTVEGTIHFNAPTIYRGIAQEDIRLSFRDGKIVGATSSESEHLNRVLDADEGARYVGEFAIGFNPYITRPMKDILFDEKIAGSIHFTPGCAYEDAFNGNHSQIHWDMVLMMDPEHGGGEIWFDDRLVRKDGRFVLPELEGLNPERLTG
jgi:aminopeptidase